MANPVFRSNYVVTQNRLEKALKIEAVLADFLGRPVKGLRMLDLGSGTGEIIDHFAGHNQTDAADIADQRVSKQSYFSLITDDRLPFPDKTFDIVITNHVIEHVPSPEKHLREIDRVLKPGGIVYLATPNWLFPKETHFKLWLLHYLPAAFYFPIAAKLGRRGDRFWIFTPWALNSLMKRCGFEWKNYTGLILADPDRFHARAVCPVAMGKPLGLVLSPISPTFIHVLQREETP